MSQHTIVAIIPLYNGAKWIEQSVRSVLAQTRLPDEFIVVDDGSTDDGPAIVERLAAEHLLIKLLRKPNGGQSSARNFGIRHSTSSLIALLDQDDAWYPCHLEKLEKPFDEQHNRPLGWVYSDLDRVDEHGGMVEQCILSRHTSTHPKITIEQCLNHDMFVLPGASLVSRGAFNRVGGFDERLSGYEDDDLFLRIFRAGYENVYLREALTMWRIFPGSSSYSPRMDVSRMIYAHKLFELFPDDPKSGFDYSRHVIPRRFIKIVLVCLIRSCELREPKWHARMVDDLSYLASKCEFRARTKMRLLLPFMRSYTLSRFVYQTGVVWRARRMFARGII